MEKLSKEEVKEAIERIGYQEFYRYYQEKDILIEQQKQEIERLKEEIDLCDTNKRVIKDLNKSLTEVHKEKERLKNIINKAIKYIKKHTYRNQVEYNSYYNDLDDGVDDLLDILKGVDKE